MEVDAYTSHRVVEEESNSAEPVDTHDWDLVAFALASMAVAWTWACNSNTVLVVVACKGLVWWMMLAKEYDHEKVEFLLHNSSWPCFFLQEGSIQSLNGSNLL
jgi:hypothetical protein